MKYVKRGKSVKRSSMVLPALLVMLISIIFCGCSTKTTKLVVVRPPATLLVPCNPPESDLETLHFLKKGDTKSAATAYTRYVLDVRDAFDLCNSRIRNAVNYFDTVETQSEAKSKSQGK